MIYLLCGLFFIMLIGNYYIFKKEIGNPSIIFSLTYFVSTFCTCLNVESWGVRLNYKAFWILFLGAVEFILISYIFHYIFKKKNNKVNFFKLKEINIPKILLIALIIYDVVILGLLLKNVLEIASSFGNYGSFSEALTLFKRHTSYNKDAKLPSYLTILMKPLMAGAYVAIYIFFNNIFSTEEIIYKRLKKNWMYLIFPLLYCIQRIIESNRGSILNFFVSAIILGIILWSINCKWEKVISIKTIIKLLIFAIIGLIIFYYSATIVGRINNKKIFSYITFYIGGSIECFNQWTQLPDDIEVVNGEYTFARTINDLNELHITDYKLKNEKYSKFVYYNDVMVGNIYTSYRSWIHDFGIVGIIVLQAILAIVINILYYLIRYGKFLKIYDYIILLYGFLIYTIFMHPIDSYFYLETFTKATLLMFCVMFTLLWIAKNIEKIKINIKNQLMKG